MSRQEDKFNKRRLRTSYFTSLTSITLMLFILGFFGLLVMQANFVKKHVKENIILNVFMNKGVKEAEIYRLKKMLDASDGVSKTRYISAEEAAKKYEKETGEDFLQFLDGNNPLHASLEIHMNEAWANVDSLEKTADNIRKYPIVEEVKFHKSYVQKINENMANITIIALIISGLLFLISVVLISNTIRLSIYAHRFLIRTMKLIGATRGFIRRPFIFKAVVQGLLAALLANAALSGLIINLQKQFPDLITYQNLVVYLIAFGVVFLLGVLITSVSAYFAVNKYLRMEMDKLYIM